MSSYNPDIFGPKVREIRLSQMSEGDMVGLPKVEGGVTKFLPEEACREPRLIPEQQIQDWTILFGGDCATHNTRSGDCEAEFDPQRGLYVRLQEGAGYMAQSCSHRIPLDVLFQLIRNAGWTIQREELSNPAAAGQF